MAFGRSVGGRRTTLALGAAILLALSCVGVWLWQDLAESRQRIIETRSKLALQQSQFMSQWFGTTIVAADYVLRDVNEKLTPSQLAAVARDPRQVLETSRWLERKRLTVPGLSGLAAYGRDCVFIVSADRRLIGFHSNQKACSEQSEPIEAGASVQYIPVEKSANKQAVLLIARQYATPDGHFAGGALSAINLSYAQRWISAFQIEARDVLAVMDLDGVLLARHPLLPDAIGKRVPLPIPASTFGPGRASVGFSTISPLDHRERIYGVSKIEGVPLLMLVGFDMRDALQEWRHRAWQLGGGFVVLCLLSIAVLREHFTAVRQREALRQLATTDSLTGVANRRQLRMTGEREFERLVRYGGSLSMLMLDIDHFKAINDAWGHPTGDLVIRMLADVMRASTREQDMIGRMGGEEFAVLLPNTDSDGARIIAERVCQVVAQSTCLSERGELFGFTVSIGVATCRSGDRDLDALINRADKCLYAAKQAGRNCVVVDTALQASKL